MSAVHVKVGKLGTGNQKVESSIRLLQLARRDFVWAEVLTALIPSLMRLVRCGSQSLIRIECYRFFILEVRIKDETSNSLVNL